MSKTLILTLLVFANSAIALNSTPSAGKNYIAIMGGGSEPADKETTIFDDSMKNLGTFLNRGNSWTPTVSFNGGHTTTESVIANGIGRRGVRNTPFTKEQYSKIIEDYKAKLNSGAIKSGDQLLVWIDTHGALQAEGESSHSISAADGSAAANLTTLEGAPLVKMDEMQSLIDLANSKGVKLGIMDNSCHSGSSLALSNPNTRIVTASGPNHFGYSNWGSILGSNLSAGKSLEDVFLETLNERDDAAFPMISSPVGKEIQDQLYPLATPYFYSYSDNPHHNKLSTFLEGQVIKNQCDQADASFQELLTFSQQVEAMVKPVGQKGPKYDAFRNAVSEYQILLEQIRNDLKAMNIASLEQVETPPCAPFQRYGADGKPSGAPENQCRNFGYSHKELLSTNWDSEILRLQNQQVGVADPEDKAWVGTQVEWAKASKIKTQQLLAANPNYTQFLNYYKNLPELQTRTQSLSSKVSVATQKLYTDLYKAKSRTDTRPNPCKSFVI